MGFVSEGTGKEACVSVYEDIASIKGEREYWQRAQQVQWSQTVDRIHDCVLTNSEYLLGIYYVQGIVLRAIYLLTHSHVRVEEIETSDLSRIIRQAELGFYPSSLAPEMLS